MKQKPGQIFAPHNLITGVFIVLAISLMLNTVRVIQRNYELQQRMDTLSDRLTIAKLQNENLEFDIAYYGTDAYLELEARRRFNLAGKGEGVILLPKDGDVALEPLSSAIIDEEEQELESQDNFDSWMSFLFGS